MRLSLRTLYILVSSAIMVSGVVLLFLNRA